MLKALCRRTTIVQEITKPLISNVDVLPMYTNGQQWLNNPLKDANLILLCLYGNEVEPGNPLGSHKTLHKVCMLFCQFEQLPAALQSMLEYIYLTLCYETKSCKTYG